MVKIFKTQNFRYRKQFTVLSYLLLLVTVSSCDQDVVLSSSTSFTEEKMQKLQTDYNLVVLDKSNLPSGMTLLKPHDYQEAVKMLEETNKKRVALEKGVVYTSETNSSQNPSPNARVAWGCTNSWLHANLGGAGMFSSWDATWYQGGYGASNVSIVPVGLQLGWGWNQMNVVNFSANRFCVSGTVTFGIEVGGAVIGYSDRYHIDVTLNNCGVQVSEGYGSCGMGGIP